MPRRLLLLPCTAAAFASLLCAQAPKAKIFAQRLVEIEMEKHPDLLIIAFHVTPPGEKDNIIIASNIGRIGKKADEDDMRVLKTGKPNLEVNATGDHFEVQMAQRDKAGKIIGALAVVFPYKEGMDKEKLHAKGEEIRKEIEAQAPTLAKLFDPAK
jgi:iron complex outermembrane receptor protein